MRGEYITKAEISIITQVAFQLQLLASERAHRPFIIKIH